MDEIEPWENTIKRIGNLSKPLVHLLQEFDAKRYKN